MLSEGLTMMQVYSGAVCNLSALEGHSKGMFATRHPSHVGTAQKLSDVPGALSQRQVVVVDYGLWRAEVDSAPLNQRGWVFQERMIAARTVFFSKNQVFWECRRGRRCESYPAGEGTSTFMQVRNKSVHSGALDPQYCLIREMKSGPRKVQYLNHRTWENLWNVLVGRYVALTISFRQDKLIAIAGIAKLFAESSSLTWAAGLWKEYMPNCLLWYAYEPSFPCERTYFPTWSWASSVGEVHVGHPLYPSNREVARVIRVECMTAGDDPFGILSSASLLLQAPMMEVLLDRGDRQLALSLCGDVFVPDVIMPDRPGLPFVGRQMQQWKPDPTTLELRHQESPFVAVVVDTHSRQLSYGRAEIHLRGLILEKLQHASVNSFDLVKWRRAAFFNVNGPVVVGSSPILQSEVFSFSERVYLEVGVEQTHQPFDFDTATCLQTFDIV